MNNNEYTTGYDSRIFFVNQLIHRLDIVLNSDYRDVNKWFESILDYYDITYPWVKDRSEEIEKELRYIEYLIHGKKNKEGYEKTDGQIRFDRDLAQRRLRKLFRLLHDKVNNAGLYLPRYKKINPGDEILQNR